MTGPRTQNNGQIVRGNEGREPAQLEKFITNNAAQFALVLPKHLSPERLVRLAVSAVRTTPHLQECSLPSFASAIMACSILGLEPNTPLGHAYLIPFKNNKRGGIYETQLIVGYKGLTELMYRSGVVGSVKCTPVFDGDQFDWELGLHPDIKHRPSADPSRGSDARTLTHVYPVVQLKEKGVDPIWDVLTRAQVELSRRRSRAKDSGPWVTDYVKMALKTGIRSIATWVPSSAERTGPLAAAVAYEDSMERGRPVQAVAALGDAAQDTLAKLGAFPQDEAEEIVTADGEVIETNEREPGQD